MNWREKEGLRELSENRSFHCDISAKPGNLSIEAGDNSRELPENGLQNTPKLTTDQSFDYFTDH